MSDDRLKVGALFAGYGGLEMGVSQVLDAEPAWLAEFEAAPSRILAQRFPGVPNLGDVTKVDWAAVQPVDIITGGFPCQDVSHAGKRSGLKDGTRSGLWAQMCTAITTLRPRLVVAENVRGLLTAEGEAPTAAILALEAARDHTSRSIALVRRKLWRAKTQGATFYVRQHQADALRLDRRLKRQVGAVRRERAGLARALGTVLRDLADIGYDAAWVGLRAAGVGAPHGRFRVFVLAWPQDDTSLIRPAADPGRVGDGSPVLTLLPSPRTSDTNGAGVHGDGGLDLRTAVSLLPTPTTAPTTGNGHARNLGGEARALLPTPRATDGTKGGPNQRGSSGDLMLPSAVTLLPTPTVMDYASSGASYAATDTHHTGTTLTDATVRQPERFGAYAPAIARWESVLGRPAPAPTEATGKGGAHRLSPRFVEWLMGLPDGWVTDTETTRNEQLKALGNGVVPQQAAAAVRHLLGVREWALTGAAA